MRYNIFHIFTLIDFIFNFIFLINLAVLSKPATSCFNLSLVVEDQGAPGHATI